MKSENNTENTAGSDCQERLVSGSFTPGPWVVDEWVITPEIMRDNLDDNTEWVAVGINDEEGFAESVAYTHPRNARLIAAAPEMLKALKRIREYQGRFGEDDPQSIAADMLAKISSANS